ncbi:MAG TPA: carboxymuconolactone decarboxylase family protein [Puia sp.]|jgi:AhpD family alkylhydroperoxidase|nr:carboxymuconolactone decarboxylase family protein [Puia sp.]
MEQRINLYDKGQKAMQALLAFGKRVNSGSIDEHLLNLVALRVSQINGCAFCLDMHSKDLRAKGDTEQRLYGLNAWREAPYYSDRERAALAWAEAVTTLEGHVPDEVYDTVREQFSETELIDLTMGVIGTNLWNRINVAFRTPAGSYQPGQFATA